MSEAQSKSEGANSSTTIESEMAAMKSIAAALDSLADPDARARVLAWAAARFGGVLPPQRQVPSVTDLRPVEVQLNSKEIPGIARVSDTGELHLTVRDLKARSANDAALRIAHLAIFASERLSSSQSVSSKNTLVPMLRRYRAYDGNTRGALAQHRGLMREGDQLSMDLHCKQEAEDYIKEILDANVRGTWNPSGRTARKKGAPENGSSSEAES